ncbi:MAG: LuxR C-terminal-related transcriptional regulator [Sphingomonadales bacterium]|jgi:FixJ family two-component response regulator
MKLVTYIVDTQPANASQLSALANHSGFQAVVFPSAQQFAMAFRQLDRGVAIIDMHVPDYPSLDLIALLKREGYHHLPIGSSDDSSVRLGVEAMRAGAVNYLHRPLRSEEVSSALHEAYLSLVQIETGDSRRLKAAAQIKLLTGRQKEILRGLMAGERNNTMSTRLGLSQRTIEAYRKSMMERLGAASVAEAVRIGLDGGV